MAEHRSGCVHRWLLSESGERGRCRLCGVEREFTGGAREGPYKADVSRQPWKKPKTAPLAKKPQPDVT